MDGAWRGRVWIAASLVAVGIGGPPKEAAAYEQRRNTVSFGFQGGVTSIEGSGEFSRQGFEGTKSIYRLRDFRWGPALSVRLRYSLDRSHAVGVSFEDLRFGRKSGLESTVAKQYQTNTVFFDYYVYIARRERLTPYLVLGPGFHRDALRFSRSDNLIPPLGLGANLGVGLEYFVRPSLAIEAALRGYYLGFRGGGEWEFTGSSAVCGSLLLGFQYYFLQ